MFLLFLIIIVIIIIIFFFFFFFFFLGQFVYILFTIYRRRNFTRRRITSRRQRKLYNATFSFSYSFSSGSPTHDQIEFEANQNSVGSNTTNAKRVNSGEERPASEERTLFQSVTLTRSDHHHRLDDHFRLTVDNHFRLTGAFELDLNCTSLRRTATFVPLAHTAVLHPAYLDTFSYL